MTLLHHYGKQVVQITGERLLGPEATFHLRDSIWFSRLTRRNHSPLAEFSIRN